MGESDTFRGTQERNIKGIFDSVMDKYHVYDKYTKLSQRTAAYT